MNKLLEAIEFASQRHSHQKRKDGITPYIVHLLAVSIIISQYTKDINIIIAGMLHDVLEDTNTTEKEIESRFGKKVLNIVKDCTELDKKLDWKIRKQEVLTRIQYLQEDSILVKTSDTLHNLSELVSKIKEQGNSYWNFFNSSKENKLEYENKRLNKLKEYHPNTPLLKDIEECLLYLNSI